MQSRNQEEENKLKQKPVFRQENVDSSVGQDENLVEPPPDVDINQQQRLQREKPTFNEFEASAGSLRNAFGTDEAKNKAPISMESCPEVEKRMTSDQAELENVQIGSPVAPSSAKSSGKTTLPSSPPNIPRIHLNPDESEFQSFVEPEMDAVSGGGVKKTTESAQMESNANGLK